MQSSKIKYSDSKGKYIAARKEVHERVLSEIRENINDWTENETAVLHFGPVNSDELPTNALNIAEIRELLPFEVQNPDWYLAESFDLLKSLVFQLAEEGTGMDIRVDNLRIRELNYLLKALEKVEYDIDFIIYEGQAQPSSAIEKYIAKNYQKTLKALEKYTDEANNNWEDSDEDGDQDEENQEDTEITPTASPPKTIQLNDFPSKKGFKAIAFKPTETGYLVEYRNTGFFGFLIPIQEFKQFSKDLKPLEK